MKKAFMIFGLLLLIIVAGTPIALAQTVEPSAVGGYFKPFAGTTTDGKNFDIANHYNAGMYIFIDFWASWCGPCKRAMPDVVNVWGEFGGERFIIVGVNMDTPKTEEQMHEYIEEAGLTFPSVTELGGWNTSISKERGVRYIPQNYLLAPDGTILFKDLHGEELKQTVEKLLSSEGVYQPVIMNIDLDNDPRKEGGFRGRSQAGAAGIYTKPFANPLNIAPDELPMRLKVNNPEEKHFRAILSYDMYKPTGRRTYRVKDPVTKEVYRPRGSDAPYIYYEVEIEKKEVILEGWENMLDTGFIIPLGEDVWEVSWELKVYSIFLDREVHGASDSIDFAGFYTLTQEMVEGQGGIVYGKDISSGE